MKLQYCSYTVLLKDNVANERLALLVLRSNSHMTRELKRTELKPYSYVESLSKLGSRRKPVCE